MCEPERACVLMAAVLPLMHWRTERNFAALSPENQVQPTNKTGEHMLTRSCTDTQKPQQTGRKTGREGAAEAAVQGWITADGFSSSTLRLAGCPRHQPVQSSSNNNLL